MFALKNDRCRDRDSREGLIAAVNAEHVRLSNSDRRLWMSVIFQAIDDLDSTDVELRQEAINFLSGKDDALADICDASGLNAQAIKTTFSTLGIPGLKALYMTAKKHIEDYRLDDSVEQDGPEVLDAA